MNTTFYVAAVIAILSTLKTITQLNAVRALLYLIVSLLSVAIIFYILGAPFAAALEVITYAGAIMVLFVFVIMMLNLGPLSVKQERDWLNLKMWIGPSVLAAILLGELIYGLFSTHSTQTNLHAVVVGPSTVGAALFGPYVIGVELASMLLLAGLIGAYHLGYRTLAAQEREREYQVSPLKPPARLRLLEEPTPSKEAGAS